MELRSARLIMRPWRRGDDDLADRWPPYHDPLEPLWNLARPLSGADFWGGGFINPYEREAWAVEGNDGRLMGRISLREIDRRSAQARLGVTFGAPFVSRGYGTEALEHFIEYYFSEMKFAAMVLDVAAPNQRAVRCYKRLGFRYICSDWRQAGSAFDRRVLDQPSYQHLAHHFAYDRRGLFVEFFEMRLERDQWRQQHPLCDPKSQSSSEPR